MNQTKRLIIVSACFLTACAPPKPAAELPVNKVIPVEKREAQTATISSWNISGGIAAKNKTKGFTATINWAQSGPSAYQIRLVGPLGGGSVIINRSGGNVTYQDGPKKFSSNSAEELLLKHTGVRLPVSNLYYWVRGLPAPGGTPKEARDQYNHLVRLQQGGYTVNFTKFTSVNGVDLPSMIRLDGQGVMVKVVIKSWGA
ncbi:MAG: outer membrane lipoprotein LolB [Legionella sp.]|nr:MAG: outer membrane lipoprotein LolB [Legionella sp.]